MTAISRIDAVYREKTSPVEAVKLYTDISRHSINSVGGENPFANTRSMGLWQQPTAGYVGQVNGEATTEYTYKNGYCEEVTRTLNLFA